MPQIAVEMFTGRTLEQRREFARAVTDAAVECLGATRSHVRVRFIEMERTDVARAGTLISDQ